MSTCICGRGWDHCRICGGRSIYRLKTESMVKGVNVWQCKRCMISTSELDACKAIPDRESKEFVSKEKAIQDLIKLPLEQRLHKMIANGASVGQVKAMIQAEGIDVVDEVETESVKPKEELVIQKASLDSNSESDSKEAFRLEDLFKRKESSENP